MRIVRLRKFRLRDVLDIANGVTVIVPGGTEQLCYNIPLVHIDLVKQLNAIKRLISMKGVLCLLMTMLIKYGFIGLLVLNSKLPGHPVIVCVFLVVTANKW